MSLTERMGVKSKKSHDKSDRMANLKLGLVLTSPKLYGEAISLFAPIYERLESIFERQQKEAQHKDGKYQEHLQKLDRLIPLISRSSGFQSDVNFFLSSDEQSLIKDRLKNGEPPELVNYLKRLEQLEKEEPIRLLAYVYHMYMAIFAGGYIIKKMVRKSMGLRKDSNDGVQALSLNLKSAEAHLDSKILRSDLKKIMNDEIAPMLSEDDIENILEESIRVFEMNNKLISSIRETPAFKVALNACFKKVTIPTAMLVFGVFFFFLANTQKSFIRA